MKKLNDTAKDILNGIQDPDIRDAAANVVQEAEGMARAEMGRLGYDTYPEDTLRRILGALAAQYQ